MKKYVWTVSAALMLLLGSSASVVLADNHGDSYWKNEYRVWSPNDHSPARKKTNTTSYYNKTTSLSGGQYINIWAALGDGKDASGGHSYRSYSGSETKLWNNAVENHGSGVSTRVESKAWINGDASGVWSPDSV